MREQQTERRRVFVLNNPLAPRLCPELAEEIGLNESILLLQIEFWISISDHYIDGRYWTYQSIRDIKKTFSFWSLATINRTIKNLEDRGLIQVGNYNKYKYDRTRWFSLPEENINKLESVKVVQSSFDFETHLSHNETHKSQTVTEKNQIVTTIPDTTTEITTETIPREKIEGEPSPSSNNGREIGIIFESMRAFYGYPDRITIDPVPNYGQEGKAIKRMLERGFTVEQILETWMDKCRKAGCFKSMQYVNKDISVGKGVKVIDADKYTKGRYGHLVKR